MSLHRLQVVGALAFVTKNNAPRGSREQKVRQALASQKQMCIAERNRPPGVRGRSAREKERYTRGQVSREIWISLIQFTGKACERF